MESPKYHTHFRSKDMSEEKRTVYGTKLNAGDTVVDGDIYEASTGEWKPGLNGFTLTRENTNGSMLVIRPMPEPPKTEEAKQ